MLNNTVTHNTAEFLGGGTEFEALFSSVYTEWEEVMHMDDSAVTAALSPGLLARLEVADKRIQAMAWRAVQPWRQSRFLALAAAGEDDDQDVLELRDEKGDWSLHTTYNRRDPSEKIVRLYFKGEEGKAYEGCEVELRKGDVLILSGIITDGQIDAQIPADIVIKPPLDIKFR